MFGKFFFSFLFLGVLAVQGSPVQPIKYTYSLDGIQDIIKEIIDWVNTIIQKIKDIINGVGGGTVQEIVNQIVEALKKILGQAGEAVQECIDAEMPKINEIAMNQQAAVADCVAQGQPKLEAILDKATAIKDDAINSVKEAAGDAAMCVISGNVQECIKQVWDELVDKAYEIKDQLSGLLDEAQDIAYDVGMCTQKVEEETEKALKGVYQDIVKCISTYEKIMKFANL